MDKINQYIDQRLEQRKDAGGLRQLRTYEGKIDFCSNDYLGFARSAQLQQLIEDEWNNNGHLLSGSTGSRLISGNSRYAERLEEEIASFHGAPSSLIFNSGYDSNVGLFSSVPQRGDTIITDELIHASIIDGARLSFANKFSFRHNDLNSLEEKLKLAKGNKFVAVESVYSMDGDEAPLEQLVLLTEKYGAALIVDEAHATGVFGEKGRGLVQHHNLQERVFARVFTFGKALGCHGAVVAGQRNLRDYLINYSRSFIYSTAASPYTHASVRAAYRLLQNSSFQQELQAKILFFKNEAGELYKSFINSNSAIQSIIIGGNDTTKAVEKRLQDKNLDVRAILHPTVAQGKERLRICLHSYNTETEIKQLFEQLKLA